MDYGAEVVANEKDMGSIMGAILGGFQVAMAGFVLKDLLTPRIVLDYSRCMSYGSMLICSIWLHEVYLAYIQQFRRRHVQTG